MPLFHLLDILLQVYDLSLPSLEVIIQLGLVDDTSLLLEPLVDLKQLLSLLLQPRLLVLFRVQLVAKNLQLLGLINVLLLHVLQLLPSVRQDYNGLSDLLSQFVQFLVSLLYLLVQGLVLNLQLLEVDQVETVGELLLLLQDLLFVGELVPEGDVLKTILMHFLILQRLALFPLVPLLGRNDLSSPGEDSVGSDTSLQLLELLFNLMALGLFLVEFGLELRCHFIVPILSFFKIDSYLMDVCQSVQVLVLVHLHIRLLVTQIFKALVH